MPASDRRSVYADRLLPFAAFASGDDAVYKRKGQWQPYLIERMGGAFAGRIVVEVGCADGAFLCRLAAKHPGTAFVGLDWKHKSLFTAAGRVEALGLKNVALLRGRGQDLAGMFGDGEVDEILLLHPDPFAGADELKNRLFAGPFLRNAHAVLRGAGATLTLKTDHPGYYAWALALLGLDEPLHFRAARERAATDPSLAKRLLGEPRVRAADLLPPEHRPGCLEFAIGAFDVAVSSFDYWHDAAALAHTAGRVFAGERTFFEERFLRKRQPIYLLDLTKRPVTPACGR